jgi:exodeoxyribonuclease V alpha subunit
MIELFEVDSPHDRRIARSASGLLHTFNEAGVFTAGDLHVANRVGAVLGVPDDELLLAVALAVRAVRGGSVCVDLTTVPDLAPDLPWPDPDGWRTALAESPLVSACVLHLEDDLLYLDRYWREEGQVVDDVLARAALPPPTLDASLLEVGLERVFPLSGYDEQKAAARVALSHWTAVLTGGPGTGKTTAVAGLLALLAEQSPTPLRIALAAPTGKAAARLEEAVREGTANLPAEDQARLGTLSGQTLHRLLGSRPETRTRFRHHRGNRLPHDVVVVDESSMVSLTMMARLIESIRDDTRLVFVGDPDQLVSVEAGAVLANLVEGLADLPGAGLARLATNRRSRPPIQALAAAVRDDDPDAAMEVLTAGHPEVEFLPAEDPATGPVLEQVLLDHARALLAPSLRGDAESALRVSGAHRMLCAHREGPYGVRHWNHQIERWLGEASGHQVGEAWGREWYAGRPVLITANDRGLGLFNGDTGVAVETGSGLRVPVAGMDKDFATSRLADVETMHAMTIHKSQGSQASEVTVLLPPVDSPLLTRELFYTAVTRAIDKVRIVATEEAVRAAIEQRAQRATGLRRRLLAAASRA